MDSSRAKAHLSTAAIGTFIWVSQPRSQHLKWPRREAHKCIKWFRCMIVLRLSISLCHMKDKSVTAISIVLVLVMSYSCRLLEQHAFRFDSPIKLSPCLIGLVNFFEMKSLHIWSIKHRLITKLITEFVYKLQDEFINTNRSISSI